MTMPNFLIIGAAKSGTTALYHYLNQHPQIYMSPVKEPRFFALEGERPDFRGPADAWGPVDACGPWCSGLLGCRASPGSSARRRPH